MLGSKNNLIRINYSRAKSGILLFLIIIGVMLFSLTGQIRAEEPQPDNSFPTAGARGMVIRVEGTITSGTARMLKNGLEQAETEGYDFLLVEINSPGGLLNPTIDIMSTFLESRVPIITYVSPSGAISASAGSFILLSGHVAAMTPGTSTGAAMPVQFTPAGDRGAADEKTINFVAGHVRTVARERERNEEIAAKFVTENLTLTADEALEEGVIDLISRDREALLATLQGETVNVRGEEQQLNTAEAELTVLEMDIWERVENFLGNPEVAFLLLLVGVYGLIIGFSNPGTIIPEVGGAIALLLALLGLGIIEIDYLGLLMIAGGIAFLIIELFTPTFGIFTTIGIVLLVLGGFIFPGEPLMPPEWFANFRMLVLGVAGMSALFILVALKKILNISKSEIRHGESRFKDKEARVIKSLDPEGQIKFEGEIWKARIESGKAESGDTVRIISREGMVFLVEDSDNSEEKQDKEKEN